MTATSTTHMTVRQRTALAMSYLWSCIKAFFDLFVLIPAKLTAGYALWVTRKAGALFGAVVLAMIMYMAAVLIRHGIYIAQAAIYDALHEKMEEDPVFGFAVAVLWSGGVLTVATWAFFWADESVDQYFQGIEATLDDEEILLDAQEVPADD